MMEVDGLRPASIFGRAFAFIAARWAHMLVPALIFVVLPSVAFAYASRTWGPIDLWHFWGVQAATPILIAAQSVFAGWVAFLALDRAAPPSPKSGPIERMGTVLARLWSIIPASFVIYLGFLLGLLLLIVPGVIFGLATCVAMQALAVEGLSPHVAIARSLELTRRRRGALFGLSLMFFIPAGMINYLGVELLSGWKPLLLAERDSNVILIWHPLMYLASGLVQNSFFAEIYLTLVGISKVGASAAIAAEFD